MLHSLRRAKRQSVNWRNPAHWERWADRTIEGVSYSFGHLAPFDMRLLRPARPNLPPMDIGIRVVFDCHVVTEKTDGNRQQGSTEDQAFWVDCGGNERRFHPDRYRLSQSLPDLIRGLPTGRTKCYGTRKANYMVCKAVGAHFGGPHYQVFFDMYRSHGTTARLVMYVQTAYLKDRPHSAQRQNERPFATICAQIAGLIPKAQSGERRRASAKTQS